MTGNQPTDRFASKVWMLEGLTHSVPGELSFRAGRLTLRADAWRCFDVPLRDVQEAVFPWYYFGGGVHLTVAGQRWRLGFVRPTAEGGSVLDIREGLARGRAWRALLERRP